MGRRIAMTILLTATLAAGGCSTWRQGSTAAPDDAVYVAILEGRAGHLDVDVITPGPRELRLGAGDALGQVLYGTYMTALRSGELDGDTRTVNVPDPFVELMGDR